MTALSRTPPVPELPAGEGPLSHDERVELQQLRRIVRHLRRLVGAATEPVDAETPPKVRRTATDEDFAEVERIRRRRGIPRGR